MWKDSGHRSTEIYSSRLATGHYSLSSLTAFCGNEMLHFFLWFWSHNIFSCSLMATLASFWLIKWGALLPGNFSYTEILHPPPPLLFPSSCPLSQLILSSCLCALLVPSSYKSKLDVTLISLANIFKSCCIYSISTRLMITILQDL